MNRVVRGKQAYRRGLIAELKCVWYLRLHGYRILARRYKTKVGEIDIVARRGNTVIFIEVKARSNDGLAGESLTGKVLYRLEQAAGHFMQRHDYGTSASLRFDVMLVTPKRWLPHHIKGESRL
jgi:putative endonuclease